MRPLTISLAFTLCALLGFAATRGVREIAYAQGEEAAQPALAAAPAEPTPVPVPEVVAPPPIATPDPVTDPVGTFAAIKDALRKSMPAGIVFALYIIVAAFSKRAKPGTWLDRGRLPTMLAAGTSSLLAILLALTGEYGWSSAIGAVLVAIGTVLHSDPPRSVAKIKAVT